MKIINAIVAFLLVLMPVTADAAIGTTAGSGSIWPAIASQPSNVTLTEVHVNPLLPTIVTSLVDITSCENVEFDADIAVTNFTNVGSVSLALNYDTSKLTYLGYENLNTALEGGSYFVNARDGVVYVSWMSLGGASIGSGILMSLKFSGITGSSSLTWYTSRCEYANIQGMVFPDSYQNGAVTIYAAPYITSQPSNKTVCEGSSASFSVETEGQNLAFQWYVSEDEGASWTALESNTIYAGVNTETLLVNTTTFDMNGNLYRCEVNGSCGIKYSNSALLTVGLAVDFYQVEVTASPENGGEVTGDGVYNYGEACTVSAVANEGFTFVCWTRDGNTVTTEPSFSFIVTEDRNYVANFELGITQTIMLATGWNWFSTNVEITLADLQAALVTAYPNASVNSLIIKSNGCGQTAWNPTAQRWIGGLNTLDLSQMYMIKVAIAGEITLEGMPINPAEHPATIANGNNWIAFPLSESMTVTDAFAGFPVNGDVVKSNTGGQATWNSIANRWIGGLTTLEPGKGYIYNSKATGNKVFTFPISAK